MKPKFKHWGVLNASAIMVFGLVGTPFAQAQTSITYSATAVQGTAVSSTAGSDAITVDTGTGSNYAVGDIIRFVGTDQTTNPFATGTGNGQRKNFYVESVTGDVITVATTPGDFPVEAVNTTTSSTTQLSLSLSDPANWVGGDAPDTNSELAVINNPPGSVPAFITTQDQTVYGISHGGSGSDLVLASGGNGFDYYILTFETNDETIPKLSSSSNTRVISLGSTSANAAPLVVAGTQGLIFNSRIPGVPTGTGLDAVSSGPPKQTRIWNVDWSLLTGDLIVERGEISTRSAAGTFPDHNLVIGNDQTVTNNRLAALTMNTATTIQSLSGNSYGRIYGNNTLYVGNNDADGGDYGGSIGRTMPGTFHATNVVKIGTGTQTISGVMGGTGTLTVQDGTLEISLDGIVDDEANLAASGGTLTVNGFMDSAGDVNANGGVIELNSGNFYTGQTNINSGGTVKVADPEALGGSLAPALVVNVTTTSGSPVITVDPGTRIVIGSHVSGTGIPTEAVVGAYDSATGEVTLSEAATADGTVPATFENIGIVLVSGTSTATVAPGTPIAAGMAVEAAGIPSGTRVSSYDSVTGVVTLGTNATADGAEVAVFSGTTSLNSGGILDLNGQAIVEQFASIDGSFYNSDLGTPGEVLNEIVNVGNSVVDGPGDVILNNIRRTNGVTRRLTKNGSGTLTLGGDQSNNRYGLTVNEGDVVLAKTSGEAVSRFALIMNDAASTVTLENTGEQIGNQTDGNGVHEINAGTLDLNGFDESLAALSTSNGTEAGGIVTNSNTGMTSTFTLLGANVDASWPGSITGDLNLVKQGSNTQTLTGTSTYTGTTSVNGGCLVFGQPSSIPASGTGTTVGVDAGLGFVAGGFSDAEIETVIGNVSWDVTSDLVFSVSDPDTEVVSADLSAFPGDTIVLKGDGTLDLSSATLPAGVGFEAPDGGTILGVGFGVSEITVDSITTTAGTTTGLNVSIDFTAEGGGNIDVWASEDLQGPGTNLGTIGVGDSPFVEEDVTAGKRFYILVPTGSGDPFP